MTRFFDESQELSDAIHRVNNEADIVWVDGHSDYGPAFDVWRKRHTREGTDQTSGILLGAPPHNSPAAHI